MTVLHREWRRVAVAAIGIALGAFAMTQTAGMSELGRIFPMTASLIAIASGLGVLVQVVLRPSTAVPETGGTDYVRAGLLAAALLIWALSLEPLGFVPASAVAVVVVSAIARREPMSLKSIVLHAIAGVFLVFGFSLLLSEVLNVRLP